MKKLAAILLSILSLATIIGGCRSVGPALKIGDNAPDFTLVNVEGQSVSLSDYQGKIVILNFWASWCGPCQHEMPYLEQVYQDIEEDVVLLGVNVRQPQSAVAGFMSDNGLTFPVVLDIDGSVSRDYGVTGIPITFFIDGEGVVRSKKLGSFTGKDEIETYIDSIS